MRAFVAMVIVLCGCSSKSSTEDKPTAGSAGSAVVAAVVIDASPPAPDAAPVARPTKEQALTAAKTWIAAVIAKKPEGLAAASALPLHVVDEFFHDACGKAPIADAAAVSALLKCLEQRKGVLTKTLANIDAQVEAHDTFPEDATAKEAWSKIAPEAERGSHTFVTFISSDPKFPSDVLLALFSVRLGEAGPVVDGVSLVASVEGD